MKLEMLSGPLDGEIFDFTQDEVLIGRGQDNDIRLTYAGKVGTTHAKLLKSEEGFYLIDLESKNGTLIIKSDNQKIEVKRGKQEAPFPADKIPIESGDIIIFGGSIWMKFLGA